MKHTSRKLLSLLMAFAIMLSLVPATALADETDPPEPTKITGVSITGATTGKKVNETYTLQASVEPSEPSGTVSYEWTVTSGAISVNGGVVSCNTTSSSTDVEGVVTCTAKQTVNGTVIETKSADANVTFIGIPAQPAVTVEVTPPTLTLTSGVTPTNNKITATVTGSTQGVEWTVPSEISAVATVTGRDGNVLTIVPKTGLTATVTGTITAISREDETKSASCTVTINKAAAASASISLGSSTINVSGWTTATASVTNLAADQYDTVEWKGTNGTGSITVVKNPSNPLQATVLGVTAGSASVTINFKKGNEVLATQTTNITVTDSTTPTVRVGNGVSSVAAGSTTYVYLDHAPTGSKVTWAANYVTGNAAVSGITFNPTSSTTSNSTASTVMSVLSTVLTTTVRITATVNAGTSSAQSYYTDISIGNATGFYLSTTPSTSTSQSFGSSSYIQFTVTPYLNGASLRDNTNYSITYSWTLNNYSVQNSSSVTNTSYIYTLYSNNGYLNYSYNNSLYNNILTCRVDVRNRSTNTVDYSDTATWYINGGYYYNDLNVGVTVYDGNTGYALTDTPDEGNTGSIASQIDSQVTTWLRNNTNYSYRDYTVNISGGTAYENGNSGNRGTLSPTNASYGYSDLGKVVFTPGTTITTTNGSYKISYNFSVRVYPYSGTSSYETLYGTMTFTVKPGTSTNGGDINYSAELGKTVAFPVDDFEDFWYSLYNRGALSYVTFGSVSGGTVYNSSGKSVGSSSYYVNPSRSQNSLDGVYFAPNSTTSQRATTIRIPFTAYGTTSSSSSTNTSRSGTIVITYLSAAASTINVATNANGTATLKAQDFIDAYKAAVKTNTTPTNLTIKFQSVPSYGTLSYKDSSKSSSRDVKLTSSNIKNYSFTTKSTGSNQLGDVTYTVSGNRTETISYIGYIGNTATFSGDVTFNAVTAPTNVQVTLSTCYSTAGVALSSSVFTNANAALLNASYVTLGTPRMGTLRSSVGPTTTNIQMSSLAYVTYVPSGTNGTDSFSFSAYNSSQQLVASGTVSVVVSLQSASAITSINQFTDIPAAGGTADWYRTQLTYLISKGMINGKGNGKFGPEEKLEYSEALKFIMNAAGIVESESTVAGTNWAQNYKNTAVQRGWMANTVDLTKPISRDAMAELTAKILGIPAATGASPFSDSSNAWAIALYNNKIVIGSDNSSKPAFRGSENLTRAEMVVLVYRMYQYSGK